jgi:hypothetical protein
MGLLMQCHGCGTMIAESVCPKCGFLEAPAAYARQRMIVEEFRRRKFLFETRQAISFGLFIGMFASTAALVALVWMTRLWDSVFGSAYHAGGVGTKLVPAALLATVAILLGVVWIKSKQWWPIELKCPACDCHLEKLGTQVVYCPACAAYLYSSPRKHTRHPDTTSATPHPARQPLGE